MPSLKHISVDFCTVFLSLLYGFNTKIIVVHVTNSYHQYYQWIIDLQSWTF